MAAEYREPETFGEHAQAAFMVILGTMFDAVCVWGILVWQFPEWRDHLSYWQTFWLLAAGRIVWCGLKYKPKLRDSAAARAKRGGKA